MAASYKEDASRVAAAATSKREIVANLLVRESFIVSKEWRKRMWVVGLNVRPLKNCSCVQSAVTRKRQGEKSWLSVGGGSRDEMVEYKT